MKISHGYTLHTLLLLFLVQASPIFAQWQRTNGPYGGQTGAIFSHGLKIIAAASGSTFVSTDLGKSWTTSAVLSGMSNITAARTGKNAESIYAYAGSGLYLSSDTGATWQSLGTIPLNDRLISISAFQNDSGGVSILAASGSEILLSTDNGGTWSRPDSTLTDQGVNVVAAFPDTAGRYVAYAGTAIGRVFTSYNGGMSWSLIDSGTAGEAVNSIAATDSVIVVGAVNGLFRSANGEKTWTHIDSGLPAASAGILGIYRGISYVVTDSGLFVSTDYGSSWKPFNNGLWNLSVRSMSFDSSLGVGTRLILGTRVGAFISPVDSADWTPIGFPVSSVFCLSAGKSDMWAATDGGVFLSSDGGDNWVNAGFSSNPVDAVIALSDSSALFSSSAMGIFRTTDQGANWVQVWGIASGPFGINNAFVRSGKRLYEVGSTGVLSSADSGRTWNVFLQFASSSCICQYDTTILVGTIDYGVLRCTDGGTKFSFSGLQNIVVHSIVAAPDDSGRVNFFAGTGQGVYRSTDDGLTWNPAGLQNTAPYVFPLYVVPKAGGGVAIFAATYLAGIFFSADNGKTWTVANTGLDNIDIERGSPTLAIGPDSLDLYAGGVEAWKRPLSQLLLPPPPAPDLQFPRLDSTITVDPTSLQWTPSRRGALYELQVSYDSAFSQLLVDSTGIADNSFRLHGIRSNLTYYWRVRASDEWGTSDWSITWGFITGTVTAIGNEPSVPLKFGLEQNYPNPFNPTTNIEYRIADVGLVTLKVYNVLGQRVTTLVDKVEQPGSYEVQFNGSNLASGVYFYRLDAGGYSKTLRMLLLK